MKNFIRYSFSILIMISCVVLFTIVSFKVLIADSLSEDTSAEAPPAQEEPSGGNDESKEEGETAEPSNPEPEKADPSAAPFTTADSSYLNDALFIGDSRTVGLREYGQTQGPNFFATTGMNVYNVRDESVNVPGVGTYTLDGLLSAKSYGKIYVMLGINELGYNRDNTVDKYADLINWIRTKAPDALIFIEANLHVSAGRSDSDSVFNNANINEFNSRISELADNKKIFYIDVNEIFDDENGNLKAECTSDNTHVLGKYYVEWVDWILTKAIVPEGSQSEV